MVPVAGDVSVRVRRVSSPSKSHTGIKAAWPDLEVPVTVLGHFGLADDIRATGPGEEVVVLVTVR